MIDSLPPSPASLGTGAIQPHFLGSDKVAGVPADGYANTPDGGLPAHSPGTGPSSYGSAMRIESSALSLSWIPSEAVSGLPKQIFEAGVTHYDEPPPDHIADASALATLREAARFRFANRLDAWIEVEDGRVVMAGYAGGGQMGLTTVSVAGRSARFEPVALPDICQEPEIHGTEARFVQTTGGRAPLPAPRHVKHPPFFQLKPPEVWTTLALTIRADGTSERMKLPVELWYRGMTYDFSLRNPNAARPLRVVLDARTVYPDVNRSNNSWQAPATP